MSTKQAPAVDKKSAKPSITGKVFRVIAYTFISLFLSILFLLLTPWGTHLAVSVADSSIDELEIEYVSGGIFSELHLSSVTWQQVGTQAKITDLKLDISLSCLLVAELCVESISTANIEAKISISTDTAEPEPSSSGLLTMPLPIKLKNIDLGELSLSLKDQLDLSWQSLQGKLTFYQLLDLDKLLIDTLVVTTYEPKGTVVAAKPQTSSNKPFDFSGLKYQPIKSLPIDLPLHFQLKQVELPNLKLNLAGQTPIEFDSILVKASAGAKTVYLRQLLVKHKQGQLDVNGKVGLVGNLEHQLNVTAEGEFLPNKSAHLQLRSAGNIDNITTDIKFSGPFEVTSQLKAQLSSEKLPLSLKVNWQDLVWPLVETETGTEFESAKGSIALTGDLSKLSLLIDTQLAGATIPETELHLSGSANLFASSKQFDISQLLLQTLGGKITSQGQLVLNDNLSWQGATQLDSIQLAGIAPDYPAELNGELNLQLSNQQGVWQGAIDKLDIKGSWLGYPLIAIGKLDYHEKNGVKVEQFLVANGDNTIEVSGTLDQQNKLDFSFNLDAPKISQSLPDVTGAIVLNGKVKGSVEQPQVSYHIDANQLTAADMQISKVGGDGQLLWDQTKPVALDLTVDNIVVAGNKVDKANLKISGNAAKHQLVLSGSGEEFNVKVLFAGNLTASAWQGKWISAEIKTAYTDLSLSEPFDINADWQQQSYTISPHCWQERASQLCIKQASFKQQKAQWELSLADFEWATILRKLSLDIPNIQTTSLFNLHTKGSWDTQQSLLADVDMSLTPAPWTVSTEKSVTLDLQAFALKAKVTDKVVSGDIHLQGSEIGEIGINLQTDSAVLRNDLSKAISGKLLLSGFNFAQFKPLIPELEVLQGVIKGQADISGTLTKPLVTGNLALENGAVKGEALPVSLSEVQQNISLNGDNATFDGSYKFGKGYGELSGDISWLPELIGNINIKGEALELNYQDMVKARISPNIDLAFSPQGVDVKGEVVVPYARVKIRELPPGSVSPSGDVILVEQQQTTAASQQQLNLKLLLKIDPQKKNEVKLDAYGLTSDLRGELRITNDSKGMLANGEVNLVNGRYRGNGQNLVIREGDISFNGTLDRPYLNIEAVRDPKLTEDDVISGLRVQGPASKPTVEIFSEPEMEQQQALSYMLTGRGIGESSDDSQDTVITNALLSIGLGQSENLVSKVGNKLGFEDVALDTSGQGDQTQLSVTGTIAPGLQLRYGLGVFDSVSEVAIRYELLPKLYVEAVSGLNNAIDFYYQFSFEGSQNEKILADEK
ncbi:translocation/assembly module TamB domain-containing protein [Paraglaciecola sp. L3A3]|uniref:autotransporter assembly complex protein TamB n=1 Tax=Paraglaciecola sp. L3A3 TaxID=2686358 RepID=UPI00131A93C5|nr:translocation/assembly module TamB domain-containing protein [Paraglaciecola sp. L3A3]